MSTSDGTGAGAGAAGKGRSPWWKEVVDVLLPGVIAAAILFTVFTFILSINNIQGSSMEPLYNDHTMVIASRWTEPKHQDIVLIRSSALNELIVKRVIGLPGDTLKIQDNAVYLNGQPLNEPYVAYPGGSGNMDELVIPEHMLFVLGDNRAVSLDSRSPLLGLVPDSELIGTVMFSFQSPVPLGFFQKLRQGGW